MTPSLSPQPSDTTNALLKLLINKVANGTFSDQDASLPVWTGPSSAVIWTQSLAYTSLSTSLLAAFGAVLGKQWLGNFKTSCWGQGSLEERCTRRQQKLDGLKMWHFHTAIAILPILLQWSLLFFAIALAGNIWTLQHTPAAVIIGTTGLGEVVYVFTLVASLTSPECPFQTPVSAFIRRVFHSVVRLWGSLSRVHGNWLPYALRFHLTTALYKVNTLGARLRVYLSRIASRLGRGITEQPEDPPIVTSKDILDLALVPADSVQAEAVQWFLETSTDTESITTAAKMVLEVEWPHGYGMARVVDRLKGHFMVCFDSTRQLLPLAQPKALACMNAIVHCCFEGDLTIPFMHSDHEGTIAFFDSRGIIYYRPSEHGFLVINTVLNTYVGDTLDLTCLSSSDRMWIAHMCSYGLLHPHNGLLHAHNGLDWEESVIDFIGQCLQDMKSLPRLVADCLLSAGLMMNLQVDPRHLAKIDKR
jgi:Family of unknown function (DUF6535)